MKSSANDHLYRVLKNRICEELYRGTYVEGDNLPPERALAEAFDMSRVTVRKALALLESEGIIERQQGSGNRVVLAPEPGTVAVDLIAVLAPAQNVFFGAFIDHFQQTAEENDSLVLFKQIPRGQCPEDTLFRLYQKGIRNVVLWLEDQTVDSERVRRLCGLGMHMVFFDVVPVAEGADGVMLDNDHAIATLLKCLRARGLSRPASIGWDNATISAVRERESAFQRRMTGRGKSGQVMYLSWADKASLRDQAECLVRGLVDVIRAAGEDAGRDAPDALLCGDGEIGVAMRRGLDAVGLSRVLVVSPDDYPEARGLSIPVYRQDFEALAAKSYQCLQRQSRPGWVAGTYRVRGELVE